MSPVPLLVVVGRDLLVQTPGEREPRRFRLSPGGAHEGAELASALLALSRGEPPSRGLGNIAGVLSGLPQGPVRVGDRAARALAEALGLKVEEAPSRGVAAFRESLPPLSWEPDREMLLALAEQALTERLASPEEVVITLSREGDRLDRLVRKESEALRALSATAGAETPVAEYASRAHEHLSALEARRKELERALEETVLLSLPNTSAILGPRTAGRLLSQAGSTSTLLRLGASRIQVIGARRRRPGSPGPRHGVLFGAEGMDRVPPSRRGALARSLASWAVVAVRADLLTHGSVGVALVERREQRIVALSRGRGHHARPAPEPPARSSVERAGAPSRLPRPSERRRETSPRDDVPRERPRHDRPGGRRDPRGRDPRWRNRRRR